MYDKWTRAATSALNHMALRDVDASLKMYSPMVHLVVLTVGLCAAFFSWFTSAVSSPVPAIIVYVTILLMTIRLNDVDDQVLHLIDVVLHAGIAVVFCLQFYDAFYVEYDRAVMAREVLALSAWVLVVCILALFVARTQYGGIWAAGYYLTFVGFGISRIISDAGAGLSAAPYQSLLQQYLSTGALLLLLYILFRLRHDYVESSREAEQLRQRANTDYLTGLPNRRKMTALVEQALERAQRYAQPFSIILFDIDHFKDVNDNHGHAAGDDVLRRIAAIVAENVRKVDRAGRWGGEEFLILAPEVDLTHATQYAERLKHLIAEYDHHPAGTVTASFGIATYHAGDTLDDVLKRADRALYRAKDLGRNRVVATQMRGKDVIDMSERFTTTPDGLAVSLSDQRSSTTLEH